MKSIPSSLRSWFVIHFVADMIFAIPLLFAPEWTLDLLQLGAESTVAARLVGAALIGIGGNSLLMRHEGVETYLSMLNLKILWSGAAILGLALEFIQSYRPMIGFILLIFVAFSIVWNFYRYRLMHRS